MTTNQNPIAETKGAEAPSDHGRDQVNISVNGQTVQIHRGRRSVAEIKEAGHVPAADDLEQIINGQMTLLPDDGHVVIRGQEVFVSHPKSTSSS